MKDLQAWFHPRPDACCAEPGMRSVCKTNLAPPDPAVSEGPAYLPDSSGCSISMQAVC